MLSRVLPIHRRLLYPVVQRMSSTNCEEADVLFAEFGNRGLITLNRPKQLNALNLSMIEKIYPKLTEWDKTKDLIVIEGGQKAFCAGGDVVAVTADKSGDFGKCYFHQEYRNNARIASLKTPYVALINGIVMGGGVGLSVLGKYRVATETTLFAMPETAIGLFPDVGVTHFLSRMPKSMGMFLALTGYRLKGYDLVHTRVATHFCHSSLLPELKAELLSTSKVENTLQEFHTCSISKLPNSKPPVFTLCEHEDLIAQCFSAKTVEEIVERLEKSSEDFSKELLKLICVMCPTSLKVTHKQMLQAAKLDVYEVLNMDYRIAYRMMDEPNIYEGIRALLVDKDKSPKWKPSGLQDVSNEAVNKYFAPLGSEELNLPNSLEC